MILEVGSVYERRIPVTKGVNIVQTLVILKETEETYEGKILECGSFVVIPKYCKEDFKKVGEIHVKEEKNERG